MASEIVHNPSKRTLTTPKADAIYPHLNTPDTKFDDEGVFKVDLAMDAESAETQELMALIDSYVDEAFEEKKAEMKPAQAKRLEKHFPYFEEENEDGEATGRIIFRTKANAQFKDKQGNIQHRTITMFDAKGGTPLKQPPQVGNGSVLKVACKIGHPWHNAQTKSAGVTMYIQAVQILELKQGGGGKAENFGFGAEEDFDGVGESESDAAGFSTEDGYDTDGPEEGEGDF